MQLPNLLVVVVVVVVVVVMALPPATGRQGCLLPNLFSQDPHPILPYTELQGVQFGIEEMAGVWSLFFPGIPARHAETGTGSR